MSKEEFKRKYEDTHKGLHAVDVLINGKKQVIKYPEDKNAKNVKRLKTNIERKAFEERAKDLQNFVFDTVAVRASDVLDSKQLPMKDLLKSAISMIPKQLNVEQNINHTFASLWDDVDITEDGEKENEE